MPKRTSLPSMFPPDWTRTISEIHIAEAWIPPLFKVVYEDQSAAEEKHHHVVEKPSLSRLANHPAEGVGQCRGQEHDRQHFDEVGERRGVLIRMSPVGVKEAAAIGAEILDDLERSHGTLRYDLLSTLDGSGDRIVVEVHRNALPDEQQAADQCSRQQDPEQGACQINPKIAKRVGALPGQAADEGNAYG